MFCYFIHYYHFSVLFLFFFLLFLFFFFFVFVVFFFYFFFFFQAEDGIRDWSVTGVQTCALPILLGEQGERLADRLLRLHGNDLGPLLGEEARDGHGTLLPPAPPGVGGSDLTAGAGSPPRRARPARRRRRPAAGPGPAARPRPTARRARPPAAASARGRRAWRGWRRPARRR